MWALRRAPRPRGSRRSPAKNVCPACQTSGAARPRRATSQAGHPARLQGRPSFRPNNATRNASRLHRLALGSAILPWALPSAPSPNLREADPRPKRRANRSRCRSSPHPSAQAVFSQESSVLAVGPARAHGFIAIADVKLVAALGVPCTPTPALAMAGRSDLRPTRSAAVPKSTAPAHQPCARPASPPSAPVPRGTLTRPAPRGSTSAHHRLVPPRHEKRRSLPSHGRPPPHQA